MEEVGGAGLRSGGGAWVGLLSVMVDGTMMRMTLETKEQHFLKLPQ